MIKLNEVSKRIFEGIEPYFKKKGFIINKRQKEIYQDTNEGSKIFDLFFYKKGNDIIIKPQIRIKLRSIEDVYKKHTKIEGRPYFTLGNHLFSIQKYLIEGTDKGIRKEPISNWLINNDKDLDKIIKILPEYFDEVVLPYFEENFSLKRVDYLLNKYPRELTVHNYLYPLRANIAIIAAKLNNNPKLEELINIYTEELEESEITYKEDFNSIKKYLKDKT